jgi:FtsP/CotA-like multicopper oxidase with cupredoxin domain
MKYRKVAPFIVLAMALVAVLWYAGQADAGPGGGTYYANSNPKDASGNFMRKFVDSLAPLGCTTPNNLGQCIPIANPDKITFPGSDYYEIAVKDYTERMHSDLAKATLLRGYVQLNNGTDASNNNTIAPAAIHYLGPIIIATRDRPVRVKFVNQVAVGAAGNLPVPNDPTVMGAGPYTINYDPATKAPISQISGNFSQNRATLHLHGGLTPWISDGTPDQWTAPSGEVTTYPKGVSTAYVPDMWFNAAGNVIAACAGQTTCGVAGASNNPGPGAMTFYWTNQQSGRLMFYHDHAHGITRLNVYAGEAAGYVVMDASEQALINAGLIPATQVPLVIQDKTFVPSNVAVQDASWNAAMSGQIGGTVGDLWWPHVYEPNQLTTGGLNPFGRWDWGPYVWPPSPASSPTLPHPSFVPESFMDTPLVNGTAYPYLTVNRTAYRFRILNACNDRTLNLQLYYADTTPAGFLDPSGNYTEVKMVTAPPGDPRIEGVPDQTRVGPKMFQIGSEGGIMPAIATLNDATLATTTKPIYLGVPDGLGNWTQYNLLLQPAERADVIIDFSQVPNDASHNTLILYNDAPAAFPAGDPRYDYFTGNPDQTLAGGAPSTLAGKGPNTRTIMQFRVTGAATPAFNDASLNAALPAYFAAQQAPAIVPAGTYANLLTTGMTTANGTFVPFKGKSINEGFDPVYGRINAMLGTEANAVSTPLVYMDPVTDVLLPGQVQLWRVTHNGVDTHPIHFHLINVQVVNRIGFDGSIIPPDANELGWKETVKMNPFQETIVAFKPENISVPFTLPDSIKPLDPTAPVGVNSMNFTNPATINVMTNLGHEYVWHCHILGHEEFDLMRPLVLNKSSVLYTDFTAGLLGLHQWDGSALNRISGMHPASMVAADSMLYADFAGDGLYKWDGNSFTLLTKTHPASMVAAGSNLYANFTGFGLYQWNGTAWTKLTGTIPASMVAAGSKFYANFTGMGLYEWNGTAWTKLTGTIPASMVAAGSNLFADFAGLGLYQWNGSAWTLISGTHPVNMAASGSVLFAAFGAGDLRVWDGTGTWKQVTPNNPATMVAGFDN